MVDMLQIFEKASGQKVNVQKSTAYFSPNVINENKRDICDILNFSEADPSSYYLGLPISVIRKKSQMLGYLKKS